MNPELTELRQLLDVTPANLHRVARGLQNDLEELNRFYSVTPGVTPEGKAHDLHRILDRRRSEATGVGASIGMFIARCKNVNAAVPDDAEEKLTVASTMAAEVRKITNLTEANTLVAAFN